MPPTRGSVRIGTDAFDALVERVSLLGGLRERDSGIAQELAVLEKQLRDARHSLADALRLIGPPKPWGAPVAAVQRVEHAKVATERAAAALLRTRHSVQEVDAAYGDAARDLANLSSSMRRARISELFRRIEESFRVLADREGIHIDVQTEGGDELVDRRMLEALGPALVHLARNSIAHGLGARGAIGRRQTLAVSLRARRAGNRVILELEDDGVGANLEELAREAAARGLVPKPVEGETRPRIEGDTSALLALLFFPGFSTSPSASELSGRGLGLDIVAQTVRRLGGTIRLDSATGQGFHVTLDIPADSGLLPVLWLDAGKRTFGVFASDVVHIDLHDRKTPSPRSLGDWLGEDQRGPDTVRVKVRSASGQEAEFCIRSMPKLEHVFVRPLGPLAASFGPFSHAVSRSDGSLRLVLDVPRLVGPA
jgi:two-component system chemotaxis sensor kinase CheA